MQPFQPVQIPEPVIITHSRTSLGGRIRNWFLTGLIIVGPLALTIYIVWWFADTVDRWVRPLLPEPGMA